MLLKLKRKNSLLLLFIQHNSRNGPRPSGGGWCAPRPSRNLGLGREFSPRAPPPGLVLARVPADSSIRRLRVDLAGSKPGTGGHPLQTLVHFSPLPRFFSRVERRPPSPEERSCGGVAAGPLAGTHVHPSGSASPSSGLTAVP